MQYVLNVCVALWMVAMATAVSDVPKCHGVTGDQLAQIQSLVVKENIHAKLTGNYSQVYGPKAMYDADSETCVNFIYTKTDDTDVAYTMKAKGKWFTDMKKIESVYHKIGDGIYSVKTPTGEPKGFAYYLFSKGNILAHFTCWTVAPMNPNMAKQPYVVSIESSVRPLGEEDTKNVGDAKVLIKAHPELFGEISYAGSSVFC